MAPHYRSQRRVSPQINCLSAFHTSHLSFGILTARMSLSFPGGICQIWGQQLTAVLMRTRCPVRPDTELFPGSQCLLFWPWCQQQWFPPESEPYGHKVTAEAQVCGSSSADGLSTGELTWTLEDDTTCPSLTAQPSTFHGHLNNLMVIAGAEEQEMQITLQK